ncbi:hypothetical protein GYMLUDRAFT_208435 [Collybiopsis luxurians FD-317 M1]|uniref:PPM-type phosphatase domain-containing protein n=1 Tax=Collybiopsis luxurians FD-317 M1 TaxID=944289 RepID=A0A0D0CA79_9AGAR|nr:hypothetical protein GYMLUDRAFT_208435 [Collybiopsis luxurians FD-317 M1]
MFRYWNKTAFRHIQSTRRRIPTASLTVGISTTLLCLTSLAVAGRNHTTIRLDSSLEDEISSEEDKLKQTAQERFQRPRWVDEEWLPAENFLYSGPTWWPKKRAGIVRCDALIVTSNPESEDSIAVYFTEDPKTDYDSRSYLALFDGHNGISMSYFLSQHLITHVANALSKLPQQFDMSGIFDDGYDHDHHDSASSLSGPQHDLISDTIKQAFKDIDDAMIDVTEVLSSPSKTNAIRTLRHAHSGSCALLSIYEPETRTLRVALTGDSRAVLGRKVQEGGGEGTEKREVYEVLVLSQDQNAHNPSEVARLEAEHPGEQVVKDGRVMGWGMARAFGDAAYKWSLDIQKQLYERYLGDPIRSNMKTPPYLTAEPEVTATRIQKGDFLIMASDGLWDCLTSEEAVGLLGLWLSTNHDSVYNSSSSPPPPSSSSSPQDPSQIQTEAQYHETPPTLKSPTDTNTYLRHQLPLKIPLDKDGKDDKTVFYPWWRAKKRFVNRDENPTAHLARNALGGADSDLTEALMSITSPRSRRYRDDIGIIVAFF